MGFVLIAIGAFLGGFVQTVSGFAGGIMVSLFANTLFNPVTAAAINNSICLILSPVIIIPFVKKIQWKYVIVPWIFYIPTSAFLVTRLKSFNLGALKIAFGCFLIILALYFLIFASKAKITPNLPTAIVICVISGACQALFAIGGPLMALYFSAILQDKEEYIATTQCFFTLTSITALTTRILSGHLTASMLPYTFIGWVMIITGRLLAKKVFDRIDSKTLKKIIYFVMIFAGAVNIITQLTR